MLVNLNQHQAEAEDSEGMRPSTDTGEGSTYDNCMGRGVGGSNLGQTQVELSGLNRVFHELGPPRGVLSTYTDSLTCQVISPPTWGGL